MNKHYAVVVFFLFCSLMIFLGLNRHSRSGTFNYHAEIWGDKAGYYVYLPASLIYHFQAEAFPDSIAQKTGNGFSLDSEGQLVHTKYPMGVAMLQLPFFLGAHLFAHLSARPADGFSLAYHKSIDIAAAVYLSLAFMFLYLFLRKRYKPLNIMISLLIILASTNLYYYTIDESGMSHIYSFFVLSLMMYLSTQWARNPEKKAFMILLSVFSALFVLIRPVNILLLPLVFLYLHYYHRPLCFPCRHSMKIFLLSLALAFVIVFLPQFFYWEYSRGAWFRFFYPGEGFTHLLSPRFLKLWFSTYNGLFTYSPILLFVFLLAFFDKNQNHSAARAFLLLFFVWSYITASWWSWHLGCAYGSRGFVDYLPLLAPMVASQWNMISQKRIIVKITAILIISLLIAVNIKITYCWDGCWYGGDWDWKLWWETLIASLS